MRKIEFFNTIDVKPSLRIADERAGASALARGVLRNGFHWAANASGAVRVCNPALKHVH
jgi:hypothetical protein